MALGLGAGGPGAGLLPMEWPEAKQMVPWPSSRPFFGERKSLGLCSNGVNLVPSISRFRSAGREEGAHTSSDCPGDCISACETPSPHSRAVRTGSGGLQGRARSSAVILGSSSDPPAPAAQVSVHILAVPEDEAFHYNNRLPAHGGGAGTTWAGTPVSPGALGGSVLGRCWGAGVGEGEAE